MSFLETLHAAGIADAARDLRKLEAHFSGKALEAAVDKRAARMPMAQILGYRDFWKDRFLVTGDVLDPRPDSEVFVELASAHQASTILDLGCGTGALGLTLLREIPNAMLTLADYSAAAIDIAQKNAEALGLAAQVQTVQSDWLEGIAGRFDLIICNPPYIGVDEMASLAPELSYEPEFALTDGADGLSVYRKLAPKIGAYLSEGGRAFFEHGYCQQRDVVEIFAQEGFNCQTHRDLSGNPRIVEIAK